MKVYWGNVDHEGDLHTVEHYGSGTSAKHDAEKAELVFIRVEREYTVIGAGSARLGRGFDVV